MLVYQRVYLFQLQPELVFVFPKSQVMILDMLHPNSTKAPVHANLDQCIEILKHYRPKKAHIGSAGFFVFFFGAA